MVFGDLLRFATHWSEYAVFGGGSFKLHTRSRAAIAGGDAIVGSGSLAIRCKRVLHTGHMA